MVHLAFFLTIILVKKIRIYGSHFLLTISNTIEKSSLVGDILLQIIDAIFQSGVLIPGLALCFGFYIAYVLVFARNVDPMTREEAEKLWKFHKETKSCKAKTWQEIIKKNELVVFECECGHKHIQKKHLITVG